MCGLRGCRNELTYLSYLSSPPCVYILVGHRSVLLLEHIYTPSVMYFSWIFTCFGWAYVKGNSKRYPRSIFRRHVGFYKYLRFSFLRNNEGYKKWKKIHCESSFHYPQALPEGKKILRPGKTLFFLGILGFQLSMAETEDNTIKQLQSTAQYHSKMWLEQSWELLQIIHLLF